MRLRVRSRLRSYDRALQSEQGPVATEDGPYPSGWYFARFGEHLRRGQVVPVTFMSQSYALFRTREGHVGMVDSQCCHLGADLSRCGSVSGERLVCGYHAWEFDRTGHCTKIPGMDRIPPRARQRSVPVLERGGNIWFWYGDGPPLPFVDVDFTDDRRRYVTLPGEVSICHGGLLPLAEHVTDVSHWPFIHGASEPMQYVSLRNEGRHFEYRVQPSSPVRRMQGFFRPYILVTLTGPASSVVRSQHGPEPNRDRPFLAAVLGSSPVRDGATITAWRIAVRKLGPDWLLWPVNRLLAVLLWWVVRRNFHADLEILRWTRPPAKPLWVKADGPSVREFQHFYRRQIVGRPQNPQPRHDAVEEH
ncbi:Rieske 2Fe-2S domain-containing protein [Streptomyces piniterrae]|uniref:Rieske 2Fe-2S domain-containing protein n=1 Tax=Streptomyces piniterrae TaxID=2571125 RepID=UPI00145DDEC6